MKRSSLISGNDSQDHNSLSFIRKLSSGKFFIVVSLLVILLCSATFAEQQYEFCNNFLMNLSFITGTDRGMAQNLDDNFGWMHDQGYTHLRFFGILPDGVHCFPSPTLNANGYPQSSYHESVLELLVIKAQEHDIIINFDGWEVIAEANYDTIAAGVGYVTPEELRSIVEEVLTLGIDMITEEQFGSDYIQEMQSACSQTGAGHETTMVFWWQNNSPSLFADMQLANVFSFYPYNQAEVDAANAAGYVHSLPSNIGTSHFILESCRYFNIPTSIAVGSFGIMETENWRNVLRFVQLQHQPDRFSIEEENTAFTIWDQSFNFMTYVGNDLISLAEMPIGERPMVNLILDAGWIYNSSFLPSWYASLINAGPIVSTFTAEGYKVVATIDTVLPEADAYYVLLAGGPGSPNIAELPEYIPGILENNKVVFLQPTYGIPDETDGGGWEILREFFGLPSGETETFANAVPETVNFNGFDVMWRGGELYLTSCLELLRSTDIDISQASVALSGTVGQDEVALVLQSGTKFLVNSNLINIEASYIFSNLLSGCLNRPTATDVVIANGKCLLFAEYDTEVEVDLPWAGNSRLIRYDPYGYTICDQDTLLPGTYSATLLRGELVILIDLFDYICGDANSDNQVDILDVVYLINYKYKDGPAPDPIESSDVNSDGNVNILDIVYLINYKYKEGPEPDCQS